MNGLDISEHGVYGYSEGLVATDDYPSNGNGNGNGNGKSHEQRAAERSSV